MKQRDQAAALELIDSDAELRGLRHLRAPYLDLEVGVEGGWRVVGGWVWRQGSPYLDLEVG